MWFFNTCSITLMPGGHLHLLREAAAHTTHGELEIHVRQDEKETNKMTSIEEVNRFRI